MPDSLFTFAALTTLGGAALLCYLIVAYTKAIIDRIWPGLPTDIYAVFVAFVILLSVALATGANPRDWRVYMLAFFNAFLVAVAAGKLNDTALRPPTPKNYGGPESGV